MTLLNDAEIRPQLISWLNGKAIKPQMILNEVTISDGSARPDIIAIYSYSHCYEIKGDNDQIERISKQLAYYQASFKKNTLITTHKHLKKALELLPSFWGIIVAIPLDNKSIIFKYARKSSYNPSYRKDIASKILWKEEMQKLLKKKSISFNSRSTRFDLIELIKSSSTSNEVDEFVCNSLLNRKISQHI
ncbi:sce7726 family protein [Acinetobacter genomosp. 15BJ]|uniref:Sce7726 family protein n=1 Tax=Acinetobacter genomosp. 15BJ TaxID=106651 RepID=A0ABT8UX27_9GAMM|nr:sce7726 family protein [Acinetobacter genomosp. 15BJ]MDO3656000.1 sce7726 family protein [Acinetobacter genomosp. 15BJ]